MFFSYNKRTTNVLAAICLALAVVGFWAGYDQFMGNVSFWTGFMLALVITVFLGATSYYYTRQRLSSQTIANADKTMAMLATANKTFWYWFTPLVAVGIYFSVGTYPVIYGFGIGLFACMSLMILLDNLALERIFAWNINDPRLRASRKKHGL